jgi:hypothetical protein
MPRSSCIAVAFCVLAAGALCVFAPASAVAKHRSTAVAKKHKSSAVSKHRSSAASKHKSSAVAKHKSSVVASRELVAVTPRTPIDKYDCIAISQALYEQATTLSSRTKHAIPRDFERVVSKLDELCGEEEFAKARVSIEWMDTCLKNFTKDYKLGFCSRNMSYFCAVEPRSDNCPQSLSNFEW